jgi:putative protease
MNVTNIETANLLSRKGLKSITLSSELNQEYLRNFVERYAKKFGVSPNVEMIVYGHTELMLSKYCPIAKVMGANKTHCHLCEHNQYALKDRMDYEFQLLNDGDCNIRLLNPKPLCLIDSVSFFKENGFSKIRMDFTTEDRKATTEIVEAFQHALKKEPYLVNRHDMTYGRFLK